jgi:hypothetical protein
VEIETLNAQAETEPLMRLAEQVVNLKAGGPGVLEAYLRNVRLDLLNNSDRVVMEGKP